MAKKKYEITVPDGYSLYSVCYMHRFGSSGALVMLADGLLEGGMDDDMLNTITMEVFQETWDPDDAHGLEIHELDDPQEAIPQIG